MQLKSINLLLVEDNPDEVVLIKEQLGQARAVTLNIVAVDRLGAALQHLALGNTDVVLLDLTLPDSQGLDTFSKMHTLFPDIPIIVLTCIGDEDLATRLVQEGAQDYRVKGQGDVGGLISSVRYAIGRNNANKSQALVMHKLRELNETKSQFVSEVSHEIRTPLAIIREFVALVRDETAGPLNDKQRQCLAAALRNCDKLADLINNILDLARIEAGKVALNRIKVDMAALLTQAYNDFMPVCRSAKQSLVLDVPETISTAHCDVLSVQNILTNLVGNARKFTPENGTITIRARDEGNFVRVDIEDTGPGIPNQELDRIFEAFVQVGRQDGPGPKGTGLGLKICKNLVELNGGCITVASTVGKGSCFTFTLPAFDKELPPRILIVDDDKMIVRLMESKLKASDVTLEVKSTLSALDALIIAGEFKPNLVILDINLAEVAGERVLLSLKQKDRQNACKVILISGDWAVLKEMEKHAADGYLAKPFGMEEFANMVQRLLGIEQKKYLYPTEEKMPA